MAAGRIRPDRIFEHEQAHERAAAGQYTGVPRAAWASASARSSAGRSTPLFDQEAVAAEQVGAAPVHAAQARPATAVKSSSRRRGSPRSAWAASTASASGCSEPLSRLAAHPSTSSSANPPAGQMAVTVGRPSVRVPVLSTTTWVRREALCRASLLRMSTLAWAARLVPTMMAIGVARPSAQGRR